MISTDVAVIGGGQAGLAAGFHLRRRGVKSVILDANTHPGGAWQHFWDSMRMFSPAAHSPLPGWRMPPQPGENFPTANHVVEYFTRYEDRYDLQVQRGVRVLNVRRAGKRFLLETDHGDLSARAVISATGTWENPVLPEYPDQQLFCGDQVHTVDYTSPEPFAGKRVVVVGGGNSGPQVLADVSRVAETLWVTQRPPRFMPDDVDGRVLFDVATAREAARREGLEHEGVEGLGDIVMVPAVKDARSRGVLKRRPMFEGFTARGVRWADGSEWTCDAVIWCTGFRPALSHLDGLDLTWTDGHPATEGTRSVDHPGLHLLGYGDWTGFASATIIGAARTSKSTVAELIEFLA